MALLLASLTAGCGGGGGDAPPSSGVVATKAITAYSLAGVAGTINEPAKVISVTMPYGTNVTNMVATFTTTGTGVTVGTAVQASGATQNDFTTPVAYIVTAADGSTATYAVTVTVAPSSAKAMTAFSFAGFTGATGIINEPAKTIAVNLPNGTNVTALVAAFTTTGAGVTIGSAVQTSGTTANNFTAPVAYIVTAADGSTATYTVTVTVAPSAAKAIAAYSFVGFTGYAGVVNASTKTIAVTLPSGTNVTALIATFTTTGTIVKVGATVQTSGATANNFTAPVTYMVVAADGTTVAYTVTVTVPAPAPAPAPAPLSSAKAMTAYSFAGYPGSAGTIDEAAKTIAVTVPNGTDVTALVATFTTTGVGVNVGAAVQTSTATANDFTAPLAYTVTAANGSTAIYNVTVTVAVAAAANPTAPNLGEAGRFVLLASQAVTTTPGSVISNGDIGIIDIARTGIAGFTPTGPAGDFTELTNGTSYAPDDANPAPFPYPLKSATLVVGDPWATTGTMITQVRTDLGNADTFLAADPNPGAPTQVCPIELGTLVLTRGVYKTAVDVGITTGPLHLDAQGDPNAVFIFSIGGTLTTGASGSIVLDNGALAKNVYFRTAGITTIAAGTTFYGNVFANTQVNVLAGANVTGRLFAITDRVTLISNTITKAP